MPSPPEVSGEVLEAMCRAHSPEVWFQIDLWETTHSTFAKRRAKQLAAMSAALKAGGVVEALEPFVVVGRLIEAGWGPRGVADTDRFQSGAAWRDKDGSTRTLTVGDFRRAASIFTQGEQS